MNIWPNSRAEDTLLKSERCRPSDSMFKIQLRWRVANFQQIIVQSHVEYRWMTSCHSQTLLHKADDTSQPRSQSYVTVLCGHCTNTVLNHQAAVMTILNF